MVLDTDIYGAQRINFHHLGDFWPGCHNGQGCHSPSVWPSLPCWNWCAHRPPYPWALHLCPLDSTCKLLISSTITNPNIHLFVAAHQGMSNPSGMVEIKKFTISFCEASSNIANNVVPHHISTFNLNEVSLIVPLGCDHKSILTLNRS